MKTYQDHFGVEPDIKSWLYADAYLRGDLHRAPRPKVPFWYREPGLWLPLSCAVAFDNFGSVTGSTTSMSGSFTVGAGSNMYAIASVYRYAGTVTSVTLNGVTMVDIGVIAFTAGDGNGIQTSYELAAPTSGSFAVVGTGLIDAVIVTYSGVDQTNPREATPLSNWQSQLASGDITCSLTTTVDNDWATISANGYNNFQVPTAGAGVNVTRGNGNNNMMIGDSNGVIHPAGSYSMTIHNPFADVTGVMTPLVPGGAVIFDWIPPTQQPEFSRLKVSVVPSGPGPGRGI